MTQWPGWSTWPYIIVDVVGRPTRCAVLTTSIHCAVGSLPLVSTQRTSSSRISAAVPGSESTPASFAAVRNSAIDSPVRATPFMTSIGEYACTCRDGSASLTALAMSKYAVPGISGSMPPCMHTSVAPTSTAIRARVAISSRHSV